MSKKNILFIMPEMLGGGAEKVLIDIFKNFDFNNYHVTLLLEYGEGPLYENIPKEIECIKLFKKNTHLRQAIHRRLYNLGLYFALYDHLYKRLILNKVKIHKYDTIVSFMEGSSVRIHSYLTHLTKKNISWVHIDFSKKHWSLEFFRNILEEMEAYSKMDHIIFVSKDAKESFHNIMKGDDSKYEVIYNLIDKKNITANLVLSSVENQERRITIGMVGRLNKQKCYDRAIEALKILVNKGHSVSLQIIGTGELESELKDIVKALELDNNVKFLGFVNPPYSLMANCDIFLNTSSSEGYPLTICEAMCLKLPIVATNITGAREILNYGEYGILTDENVNSIAKALEELIKYPQKRNFYSQQSSLRSEMFSPETTMNEIYDILS